MMRARRWAALGAAIGAFIATLWFAPAAWLAGWLARASDERVLLADARGTVWRGSALLVLTGGPGSRDAMALPGRVNWHLRWQGRDFSLRAQHACCLNDNFELRAEPGIGSLTLRLLPVQGALMQWPAAWLAGLGAPWNTLQLGGVVRVLSPGLTVQTAQGRVAFAGRAEVLVDGLSSRLSSLPTLGSYRLALDGQPAGGGVAALQLVTVNGPLLLSGAGQWGGGQALRFRGEARAEADALDALNNLLNIIGRRQGPMSILSIG